MTAPHIINPASLLDQALGDASPDLIRHLLSTVINTLLSAEADAVCGAEYGTSSPERVHSRNGYRHRELDTRIGHHRRRRAEATLRFLLPGVAARAA